MPAATLTVRQKLLDVAERTAVTAGEAVLAVLLAKGALNLSGAETAALGALAGGLAAARAVLANWLLTQHGPREWAEDLLVRASFTFAQTLVAALLLSTTISLPSVKAAAIAGVAAALAAIKAAVARGVSSDPVFTPASLLPSSSGGQQPGNAVA